MNPDKIVSAEIVKMRITDINQALEILTENRLEVWRYNDLLSEIQRPDSLALAGKIKTRIVGFCIARLIRNSLNHADVYTGKTINSSNTENFTVDLIYPEPKKPIRDESFEAECEIYNIAIKREFQDRGIGKQMINKLVLLAKEYNCRSIWLEVRNSNTKAINFYQKSEFRQIYERKNFYSNPLENAIVMKRNLQTVSKQINSRA